MPPIGHTVVYMLRYKLEDLFGMLRSRGDFRDYLFWIMGLGTGRGFLVVRGCLFGKSNVVEKEIQSNTRIITVSIGFTKEVNPLCCSCCSLLGYSLPIL